MNKKNFIHIINKIMYSNAYSWHIVETLIISVSIVSIVLEEMEKEFMPINPTIIRVTRILRVARALKLLKTAEGLRSIIDTLAKTIPQVSNLILLYFVLFFMFAALGVELFARLECSEEIPCIGLSEHANFQTLPVALLTLFRISTGDNWNRIYQDAMRDQCDDSDDCERNCCISQIITTLYFIIFVLLSHFVLTNIVIAVLMKHMEATRSKANLHNREQTKFN